MLQNPSLFSQTIRWVFYLGIVSYSWVSDISAQQRLHNIHQQTAKGKIQHCDEAIATNRFLEAFKCGKVLFETRFNHNDGVGINVGNGSRFTRVPRADLNGNLEWNTNIPRRSTGPNALACNICHFDGGSGGSGPAGLNVIRDPFSTAKVEKFIQRNPPHLHGQGGLQLLAEEMNLELENRVSTAVQNACHQRKNTTSPLIAKGIHFGSVTIHVEADKTCPTDVEIQADGVDDDLIIRPFQWKGSDASVRSFVRGAFHNELGMQPVELTGNGIDGDGDGIVNEIHIADVTAMVLYVAAQPRPTSLQELDEFRQTLIDNYGNAGEAKAQTLGLPHLTSQELKAIAQGKQLFHFVGCAKCHVPQLTVNNPIFREPSQNLNYRDVLFPAGQVASEQGLDSDHPVWFDITKDQPDNKIMVNDQLVKPLGSFETDSNGHAIVRLYGDLKRHDLGPRLAEPIDEVGTGASVWITKELWGVGSTAPYLHDGRATTLQEAILEHGGEANLAKNQFLQLTNKQQDQLIAFLKNLVLFLPNLK